MSAVLQHRIEKLAALLPPLLLEAERVASIVQLGIHGRRRAGIGESFWQFRRYSPGDPAEKIDWRQSARTDRLFIREREWEAAQTVYFWSDDSGSMDYRFDRNDPTKTDRAHLLTLALASLLLRGGEKSVWLGDQPLMVHSRGVLERIAAELETKPAGGSLPPDVPLVRHGQVILASDFLMEPAALDRLMRRYAAYNMRGVLLHILDAAEVDLPFEGRIEMRGTEGENPLLLPNAGSLRERYREKIAAHKARLMSLAESAGWFYARHVTSDKPHPALLQLYHYLAADPRGL